MREDILVTPEDTLREVMVAIDAGAIGIALVVDRDRTLLGTITDGDIRRTLLAGRDLEASAGEIIEKKVTDHEEPVTAPVGAPRHELISLMEEEVVGQIPLLDDEGRVQDIVTLPELQNRPTGMGLTAVVMAGGFGTRLRPLTDDTPKPMLPVGGKPLLQRSIERLCAAGVRDIYLTTHYMHEEIVEHFGDGSSFGVNIRYIHEEEPLGTAGALSMLPETDFPLLVMNGDVLTHLNFPAMLEFHQHQAADLTIGVRRYEMTVPYGVVETEGANVEALVEKPDLEFLVNAGVYLLEPTVLGHIPDKKRYEMPELIGAILGSSGKVLSFPIHEYWMDIGQPEDYKQARKDVGKLEGRP